MRISIRSWSQPALTALLLVLPCAGAAAQQRDTLSRPKVLVLATGGTIAGVQDAPGTLGDYRAGTLSAEQILASVPTLSKFARVETEQFSNVASPYITPAQWVALSRRIDEAFRTRPDLAGVVVTHGTDRLEETAFFLYLTVHSDKPVIVVGAQRPATGISPDGPINLLSAVRTAASPQATGKGVMVVMDDRIISAREARKLYPRSGGFSGGEMGMLGVVSGDGPEFFFAPTRKHGAASEFDLSTVTTLGDVDLVYAYPGGTGRSYDRKPDGVVVSRTGFTCAESASYQTLARSGVVVATVFTSGEDVSEPPAPGDSASSGMRRSCPALDSAGFFRDKWVPTVAVQHLTPQKARILLMLALTKSRDPREIQRYFNTY